MKIFTNYIPKLAINGAKTLQLLVRTSIQQLSHLLPLQMFSAWNACTVCYYFLHVRQKLFLTSLLKNLNYLE